jgi:hypothetical protein
VGIYRAGVWCDRGASGFALRLSRRPLCRYFREVFASGDGRGITCDVPDQTIFLRLGNQA